MMEEKLGNEDYSIKIGNSNNFRGDTAIGENAKIEKHIHDNSINHTDNKLDLNLIENISKHITNNYNERKASLLGGILTVIGLLGDLISINSILPVGVKIISFIPKFNLKLGWIIISLCSLLLIVGIIVLSAINHKYNTTCPKCHKIYAMDEAYHPQVREVKAHDGVKRTVIRNFICKYCSYKKEFLNTETIPYENY